MEENRHGRRISELAWIFKHITYIYNSLYLILGCGLLAVGLWLFFDPTLINYVTSVDSGLELTYYTAFYAVMGCGGLMIIFGIIGCCGACFQSQCLLVSFFMFLLLLFVVEVGGGTFLYLYQEGIYKNQVEFKLQIDQSLKTSVQNLYTKNEKITEAIDFIQINLKCCGAQGPADWMNSEFVGENNTGSTDSTDSTSNTDVPDSCCQESIEGCGTDSQNQFWAEGCSPPLQELLLGNYILLAGIAIGVGAVHLLGMIFSICMCCGLRKKDNYIY